MVCVPVCVLVLEVEECRRLGLILPITLPHKTPLSIPLPPLPSVPSLPLSLLLPLSLSLSCLDHHLVSLTLTVSLLPNQSLSLSVSLSSSLPGRCALSRLSCVHRPAFFSQLPASPRHGPRNAWNLRPQRHDRSWRTSETLTEEFSFKARRLGESPRWRRSAAGSATARGISPELCGH